MQSNDCSDTNWYWHPNEQKCARGKGALGISFSELSACCKQVFGENGCDWHDECKRKQPDVVETSDGPVEVDNEEFFKFYDNDNSACDLLRRVRALWPDFKVAFANGGDRTSDNIPEIPVAEELGVHLIWGVGGGKVQSSSDLVNAHPRFASLKNQGK